MRWALACCAGAGCALLGVAKAASLRGRARSLRAWLRCIARLEARLSLRAESLADLLACAASGESFAPVREALASCAKQLSDDPLSPLAPPDCGLLNAGDRAALSPLWECLGETDERTQRDLLLGVRAALGGRLSEAEAAEARDRRLALSLGGLGAAAAIIILI